MVERDRFLDAQYSVLGSMLIDERCVPTVMSAVSPSDFHDENCALVFAAIRKLHGEGQSVDPVVVAHTLSGMGEELRPFLLQLMDITPTASNVSAYIELLKQGARLAQLHELAFGLCSCTDVEQASVLLDKANKLVSDRGKLRRLNMEQMLLDFHERHQQAHQYISFGMQKLDEKIFAEPGDFIILGGYPSSGKTALAMSFAYHIAKDLRVGFYSLETGVSKLSDRLVSYLSKLTMSTIKHGAFSEQAWSQVIDKMPEIPKRSLELIEAGGLSVQEIRSDAIAKNFDFIIIDYLQLIRVDRRSTRAEEVAEISRTLHTMSQRDKITVFALSQLTRPERGGGAKPSAPTMRDLRESGQLEQDADCVMLLYEADTDIPTERYLKIAKNKEGERGRILLDFAGETQSFSVVSNPPSIAGQFSAKGRAAKAGLRAQAMLAQTQFTILEGDDPDCPFDRHVADPQGKVGSSTT